MKRKPSTRSAKETQRIYTRGISTKATKPQNKENTEGGKKQKPVQKQQYYNSTSVEKQKNKHKKTSQQPWEASSRRHTNQRLRHPFVQKTWATVWSPHPPLPRERFNIINNHCRISSPILENDLISMEPKSPNNCPPNHD
jgi:hypothetical protein